ncbi:hypothetical protein J4439_00800 [Candidatus Woesearchaeota archaeon]|nr:hypothetical protein [Candidatus Woesearchaeota archaeon]
MADGLEGIVQRLSRGVKEAAAGIADGVGSLYSSYVKPVLSAGYDGVKYAAGWVKDLLMANFVGHAARDTLDNISLTSALVDQRKQFYRGLAFDLVKDTALIALGVLGVAAGPLGYLAGGALVAYGVVDLLDAGVRYGVHKASGEKLYPSPLANELWWLWYTVPWALVQGVKGAYHALRRDQAAA